MSWRIFVVIIKCTVLSHTLFPEVLVCFSRQLKKREWICKHCIYISELLHYFVVMWNIIGCWSLVCSLTGHTPCLVNKFQNLLFSYCVALNDIGMIKSPADCTVVTSTSCNICDATSVSVSVSVLITLHASNKVTFVFGFIMVLYLTLFHTFFIMFTFVSLGIYCLDWSLDSFLLCSSFYLTSTYMLAAYQSWCVTSVFIIQQKWLLVQLVDQMLPPMCECVWLHVCLGICVCQ